MAAVLFEGVVPVGSLCFRGSFRRMEGGKGPDGFPHTLFFTSTHDVSFKTSTRHPHPPTCPKLISNTINSKIIDV